MVTGCPDRMVGMKPILRDMAIGCAAAWIAAAAYAGPEALPTTATDAKDKSIVTTTAPAEPFSIIDKLLC